MKIKTLDIKSKDKLINAAHTQKHKEDYAKWNLLLNDTETNIKEIINTPIADNYQLREIKYLQTELAQTERKYTLYDKNDVVVFEWICLDSSCDFQTLIQDQNGNDYFVFRQELYGYSVLDLNTKQTFQYFPQCVQDGYEDFIWTTVHYNPKNNLLAVEGCFWACPWSIVIVDFSTPMQEPLFEIDIFEFFDDYIYGEVEFLKSDNDNFVCEFKNKETKAKEIVSFNPRDYIKFV